MDVAPAITPNGDGVNDELLITYDIVNLTHAAPVSVKAYDLAGRLVKEIYYGLDSSGRYQKVWDGTDDDRQKMGPGIYLVHLGNRGRFGDRRQNGNRIFSLLIHCNFN